MWIVFITSCLLLGSSFKFTTATSIQEHIDTYEGYVNMSLQIEKLDKIRMNSWIESTQLKLVDVTTRYRMDMMRHQQHSFRKRPNNEKWTECLDIHQNETSKAEQVYFVRANKCLRTASSADAEKRQAITQVGREIRKWRRSYRYLMSHCQTNNPESEEKAKICLVNYVEKDNYSNVFQRLINLRLQLVQELHNVLQDLVFHLEDCLKQEISRYLEQVRKTVELLNKCYGL